MSFLDAFTDDMRTLTLRGFSKATNTIGERTKDTYTDTSIVALFMAIGVITDDIKEVLQHIIYKESTHILRYDHTIYNLRPNDEIIDELDIQYTIKLVEPVLDFGGIVDHYTAYLVQKT